MLMEPSWGTEKIRLVLPGMYSTYGLEGGLGLLYADSVKNNKKLAISIIMTQHLKKFLNTEEYKTQVESVQLGKTLDLKL